MLPTAIGTVLTTRRLRRLTLPAIAVLVTGCGTAPIRVAPADAGRPARASTLRVQVQQGSVAVVRDVPLEDYVAAAALSEIHPDAADQAIADRVFAVQTILARTYANTNRGRHARDGFDLCSTTHCQLYEPERLESSRWAAVARTAARRTAGTVLWFAGAPARAVFHADCGGHTSNAAAVWGGVAPAYLAGSPDEGPACDAHGAWRFETRAAALRAALNGDPRTAVGPRLDRIEVAGRDSAGRAEQMILRGTHTFVVRGEVFREVVTRALGVQTVRSTLFTVQPLRDGFVFTGRGFGHGVGLCQAGAVARLRAGDSPEDVLAHYFPGATLHR